MIYSLFNLVEGSWWIGLGCWSGWYYGYSKLTRKNTAAFEASGPRIPGSSPGQALSGVTTPGLAKAHHILLASILILFGVSDFVEMVTGAWWQPWWLLVWKGLCLIIGIILVILILKQRKNSC